MNEYSSLPVKHSARHRTMMRMNREFFNTFGKRVRVLREDRGWTQEQLADALRQYDVSVRNTWISTLEKARTNKLPATDVVVALARALGTTTDYLLMMTDDASSIKSHEPMHISEEADVAARLIDELRDPTWRGYCVEAVRDIRQEYDKRNADLIRIAHIIANMRAKGATELAAHIERQLYAITSIADWSVARRELDTLIRFLGSDE